MAGNPNYSTAVLSMTFEKFLSKETADTIFNDLALFSWLNAKGKVKRREVGGRVLLEPLMYAKNSTVSSYSGYDTLDVSPQDGFTNAEFEWSQYAGAISISGREEQENAGDAKMLDLLENKWTQLRMSFRDKLNRDAFLDGSGNDGKEIVGLSLMVDSAGTYGNIARSTNSWWSAQEVAVGGALAVSGDKGMRRMYNDCSGGMGTMAPDAILTDQDEFEAYEQLMAPYLRYTITGEANATFATDTLKFRKAALMWDEECQNGIMYFLNSQVMNFIVRSGREIEAKPFQTPINQDARVAQVLFMGQLTCSNCRHLGKLTGLTDA